MTNTVKAEYLIQLEEAKKNESYSFLVAEDFQSVKETLTEVNKIKQDTDSSKLLVDRDLLKLELGNLSVNMKYLGYNIEKELAELVFTFNYKSNPIEVDKFRLTSKMYKDSNYLENSVFRYMITAAKRNKISIFD